MENIKETIAKLEKGLDNPYIADDIKVKISEKIAELKSELEPKTAPTPEPIAVVETKVEPTIDDLTKRLAIVTQMAKKDPALKARVKIIENMIEKLKNKESDFDKEVTDFIQYVKSFYGKNGVYAKDYNGGFTQDQIEEAVVAYINDVNTNWGGGDSVDRELVRDKFLAPITTTQNITETIGYKIIKTLGGFGDGLSDEKAILDSYSDIIPQLTKAATEPVDKEEVKKLIIKFTKDPNVSSDLEILRKHKVLDLGSENKPAAEPIKELYLKEIAEKTALRKEAIQNFATANGLTNDNMLDLIQGLGSKIITPIDLSTAISGTKGNAYEVNILNWLKNKPATEKLYYTQNNIGKAKYVVNYHDGVKTHKDGGAFYDIKIFKNKKDFENFIKKLESEGYKEKYEKGGETDIQTNSRMYNFLKDDLEKLEKAINEDDKEQVETFFSYWNHHLDKLRTETNDRMYNFLKDDLEKLETAINEDDKEETERFFSYWNHHLESLKMEKGGEINELKVSDLKKGDLLKKKGSALEVEVLEVGNDWRSGHDYALIETPFGEPTTYINVSGFVLSDGSPKPQFEQGGEAPIKLNGYRVDFYSQQESGNKPFNIVSNGQFKSMVLVTDGVKGDSSSILSNEPYLKLQTKNVMGREYVSVVPVNILDNAWKMFGGTFVWSSDSRFRQDVSEKPLPLHDRVEMEQGGEVDSMYLSDYEQSSNEEIAKDASDILDWIFSQNWSDNNKELQIERNAKIVEFEKKHNVKVNRGNMENGGEITSDYHIFEGYDHFKNQPIFRVESSADSDNEYVGEWHNNRPDAQTELDGLIGKKESVNYEVFIDEGDEGTRTIADFENEKDAKNFIYEYGLKHPNKKLGIDTITSDYMEKGGAVKTVSVKSITDKYTYMKDRLKGIKGNVDIVIVDRDTSGMRGNQDPYMMEIHQNGKKIADYGTVPSKTFAKGGEVNNYPNATEKSLKEIKLLLSKGYDIDFYSNKYSDLVFSTPDEKEVIFATQGSKNGEYAVAYLYQDEDSGEMSISIDLLKEISDKFKNEPVKLFTNAGVDLHSSKKGKYKNVEVIKVGIDKFEKGGEVIETIDINPKNFTLNQIKDLVPDVQIARITKGTYLDNASEREQVYPKNHSNIVKWRNTNLTISDYGIIEVNKGSENFYFDMVVYLADDKNDSQTYTVQLFTKDNILGLKKLASTFIQKMKNGGEVINFEGIRFFIDSTKSTDGDTLFGGYIDINNRVIKYFPYFHYSKKEVESAMKKYLSTIRSASYAGNRGRESQKYPYLVFYNDGSEQKEVFETAAVAQKFASVLERIIVTNKPKLENGGETFSIDFTKQKEDIINFHLLPKEVQDLIKNTPTIRSSGFRELHGLDGRKLLWSASGSWWSKEDAKKHKKYKSYLREGFELESIGAGSGNLQWSEGKPVTYDKFAKGGSTWIQKATKEMEKKGTKGLFTERAEARGLTAVEFAKKVLDNPKRYTQTIQKEAQFVKNTNPELFN